MASLTFFTHEWEAACLTGPIPTRYCIRDGCMEFCQATITRCGEDEDKIEVTFWEPFEEE